MAFYQKRIQARRMRKKGESVVQIAKTLGVSKGSVSDWCNDIALTKAQVQILMKRGRKCSSKRTSDRSKCK